MSSSGKPAARKRSARYCAIAGTWPRPSEVRNEMTFWKISRASLRTSSGGAVSLAGAPAAPRRVAKARAALIVFMGGKPIGLPRTRQGSADDAQRRLPRRASAHRRRRVAEAAMHVAREMALMSEARRDRYLRDREPLVPQEQLRTLDPTSQHVFVDGHARRIAEQRLQVRHAHLCDLGDSRQGQLA